MSKSCLASLPLTLAQNGSFGKPHKIGQGFSLFGIQMHNQCRQDAGQPFAPAFGFFIREKRVALDRECI